MAIPNTKAEAQESDHTLGLPYFDEFLNYSVPVPALDKDVEGNNSDKQWIPAANVIDEEKAFRLELALPGYTKSDIHISIDGNKVLNVKGVREQQPKKSDSPYARKEFAHNSFSRSFQLPEIVNQDEITAACNNGLLTLRLLKKDVHIMKQRTKEVEID